MSMLKDFLKYVKKQKIDPNDIYTEENKEIAIASFAQISKENILYDIMIVFHKTENDETEIIISKPITEENLLTSLVRANELNINYLNTTFFINENVIAIKVFFNSYDTIAITIQKMFELLDIANKEFPDFF